MLRVVVVEVPIEDRAVAHRPVVVFGARQRRDDEEGRQVDPHLEQPLGRLPPALGSVEGEADHVAAVDRHAVPVPVVDDPPVLLLHGGERPI